MKSVRKDLWIRRKLFSLSKKGKLKTRRNSTIETIKASGLFDESWYLKTYPDVVDYPGGPLAHFLDFGAAEGRSAGPLFITQAYLTANPDVAAAGINPLVHYSERGIKEGRSFSPIFLEVEPVTVEIGRLAGLSRQTLDLFDDNAVSKAVNKPISSIAWHLDPVTLRPGSFAGAQIILEFLRRRYDLRIRFPRALRDGPTGSFAMWVKSEGLRLLGLGDAYIPSIDAAFGAKFGAVAKQVLLFDEKLRKDSPLFLLPSGRSDTCNVLFGAHDAGELSLENIWWFLIENSENVQDALCETWAVTPEWQEAVPDGGTVFGIVRLAKWVNGAYGCHDDGMFVQNYPAVMSDADQVRVAFAGHERWRDLFPTAMRDEAAAQNLLNYLSQSMDVHFLARRWVSERLQSDLAREIVALGVNIIGHFSYTSGLKISVDNISRGLELNSVAVCSRDVPTSVSTDQPTGDQYRCVETHDITILHVQPQPYFSDAYLRAGLRPRSSRTYKIGYWYWESEDVPESWDLPAIECDELWTATRFTAAALRKRFKQPIYVLPPGLEIGEFTPSPRSKFGIGDDEYVFVFVFHMTSVLERKNPWDLIEAFKLAFGSHHRAKLIIKTVFGEKNPSQFAALKNAARGSNIRVINENFSREQTLSLIAAGDAYISLHRSEGLGFSLMEAMLLGRPVIATRYSGNLDFMNDHNSLLVDCEVVELNRDTPPYSAGQRWANPSVKHAAEHMQRLYEDPIFSRQLGERGRASMKAKTYASAGGLMASRLKEIAKMMQFECP